MEFDHNSFILRDNDPQEKYHDVEQKNKVNVCWGQRKLLLNEILFFTDFRDIFVKVKNPVILYIGAAPGIHIPMLSEMFTDLSFHLYDPAEFKIKESDKIKIHREIFTVKHAEVWGRYNEKANNVFLISDIRSVGYEGKEKNKYEQEVWGDMLLQKKIVEIINPVMSMLKFRLPYVYENQKIEPITYLDGILYKQCWARRLSTETRLISQRPYKTKKYDPTKYQDQMFYFNMNVRSKMTFLNPISDTEYINPPDLLNDFDSTFEAYILKLYFMATTGFYEPELVIAMSDLITKTLGHGKITLNELRQERMKLGQKIQVKRKIHVKPKTRTRSQTKNPIKTTIKTTTKPKVQVKRKEK